VFVLVLSSDTVTPAKAGVHVTADEASGLWIPAFAGMTASDAGA
jgi:hypothetical protein